MKSILKNLFSAVFATALFTVVLSSCKKDDNDNVTYNTYFYSLQDYGETSVTVAVDGENYGAIHYIPGAVSPGDSNLNLVKLKNGRHEIRVYNNDKKCIISCYVTIEKTGMGSGSSGPAAGGENVTRVKDDVMIGLYE